MESHLAILSGMAISAIAPLIKPGIEELSETGFRDVYEWIKSRFSKDDNGQKILKRFQSNPMEERQNLETALAERIANSPDQQKKLAELLKATTSQIEIRGETVVIAGKVVTARDVGTIHM